MDLAAKEETTEVASRKITKTTKTSITTTITTITTTIKEVSKIIKVDPTMEAVSTRKVEMTKEEATMVAVNSRNRTMVVMVAMVAKEIRVTTITQILTAIS